MARTVQSRIDESISYKVPDVGYVDDLDNATGSNIYEFVVGSKEVYISPGMAHRNDDIAYIYVYKLNAVGDEYEIDDTIGVIEMLNEDIIEGLHLDEEGELREDLFETMIYVDEDKLFSTIDESDDEAKEIEDLLAMIVETDTDAAIDREKIETKTKSDEISALYRGRGRNWAQRYFRNSNYGIKDNEGGGDCFFATIRNGFKQVGKTISVLQIRKILASRATEGLYNQFRVLRDGFKQELKDIVSRMKDLRKENKALKKESDTLKKQNASKNHKVIAAISKKGVENAAQFRTLKDDREFTKEMLQESAFISGVKSFDDFKAALLKQSYWADTWAISTLEKALNIKVIILSRSAAEYGDDAGVVQCGQVNDDLEEGAMFRPKYYIIVDYTGNHYMNISYKGKIMYTYEDLPYTIRKYVADTCYLPGSLYERIPKLREEVNKLQADEDLTPNTSPEADTPSSAEDVCGELDEEIQFQFYELSDAKPLPGRGKGEKIPDDKLLDYRELRAIPSWRKVLSNFALTPFTQDGHTWNTVEHYVQAQKFKKYNPEYYILFTSESTDELGQNPKLARAAGSKTGKTGKTQVRPSNIKMDKTIDAKTLVEIHKIAYNAKYRQNEMAQRVLLATHKAVLNHYVPKKPSMRMEYLMELRAELCREQSEK